MADRHPRRRDLVLERWGLERLKAFAHVSRNGTLRVVVKSDDMHLFMSAMQKTFDNEEYDRKILEMQIRYHEDEMNRRMMENMSRDESEDSDLSV